jgi:hypothetical protein
MKLRAREPAHPALPCSLSFSHVPRREGFVTGDGAQSFTSREAALSAVKHGRRHNKLKEGVYAQRFQQRAPGYAREYEPIDIAEPEHPAAAPPPKEVPMGLALNRRALRDLKRRGIDPLAEDEERRED